MKNGGVGKAISMLLTGLLLLTVGLLIGAAHGSVILTHFAAVTAIAVAWLVLLLLSLILRNFYHRT